MSEQLRIALDILALLAVTFAFLRGIFSASSELGVLRAQIVRNTAWIEGHEKWSLTQSEEMQAIREDIAYIRGKLEHDERARIQ